MIRIRKQREGRKAVPPLLFLLVFVISAISSVYAVQELTSLQGKVTTSAGALVNDGNLTVLVYDAPTGGNLVYNSSEDFNTSIQAGSFDVLLGSVTDMHLKLSDIYYMDLEVNGEDVDWDGEERKQFQSGVGREVSGNFSVDLSDSTFFVDEINNRVGIGTILPGDALLNVSGTIDAWDVTINGTTIGTDYAPIGTILPYASNLTVPNGYLLCDGSNVSRTTYADLFGVIGTSYGDGDGSTTFTLPDLRGRVPVGEDLSAERLANGTDVLGQYGGEENHTLVTAEMPAHTHPVYYGNIAGGTYMQIASKTQQLQNEAPTQSTGGDASHSSMQPYQVVSYIIKYGHTGTESPGTWNFSGNNLYTSRTDYNVGIGTAEPGTALLNVTGTIDAWDVTINGTSVWGDYAPVGTILPYASNLTAPNGYLLCDGSNVSRTTYADLFGVIGTAYGDGDGSTTFTLPDLRGRVPVGEDLSAERLANGTDALGFAGGEENHTLVTAEMPAHTHPSSAYSSTDSRPVGSGGWEAATAGSATGSTGGGAAHNNMQPYQIVSYIIKYGHTGTESPGTWNFTGTNLYPSRTDYNVGIGTTAPGGQLGINAQVSGTISTYPRVAGTSQNILNGYYVNSAPYNRYFDIAAVGDPDGTNGASIIRFLTNPITLNEAASERMRIDGSGNVGIGTTAPTHTLNVVGDLNVTGAIYAGNISFNNMTTVTYTADGTFTVPSIVNSVEVLVVAGGGGGGHRVGGGGGGGGVVSHKNFAVTPDDVLTVTVGAGGAGGTSDVDKGDNGANSVFGTLTATGGGGGASLAATAGLDGGCGGGGSYGGDGGAGSQGGHGGSSTNDIGSAPGGGGGGAGSNGDTCETSEIKAGNGGTGIQFDGVWYAGGGGAGVTNAGFAGKGGVGGGGNGNNAGGVGTAGTANTGGGGGGGGDDNDGGAGGSGIVIVRYRT